MNGNVFRLLDSIFYLMELGLFYFWMDRLCEKRETNKYLQLVMFAGVGSLLVVGNIMEIGGIWKKAINIGVLLIYSNMSFKLKRNLSLLYTIIFFLILTVSEITCMGVLGMAFPAIISRQFVIDYCIRYQMGIMSKALAITLIILVSHYIKRNKYSYSRFNIPILVGIYFIFYIVMYHLSDMKIKGKIDSLETSMSRFMLFVSITVSIFSIIIYIVLDKLEGKRKKEKEYALMQEQMTVLHQITIESQAFEKEWRKVKHDFNNHLSCIDMLLQMGNVSKARGYIQNLTQNWQIHSYSIHTGNTIVDAIINQKLARAKKEGIYLNVDGTLPVQLDVEDIDLCTLLSNSIDNAIEASCLLSNDQKRQIDVLLSSTEADLLIEVYNAVQENIRPNEELKTTKLDKRHHGIGIMSMQTTAQKYGGKVEWQCQNYQFQLKIMIPFQRVFCQSEFS